MSRSGRSGTLSRSSGGSGTFSGRSGTLSGSCGSSTEVLLCGRVGERVLHLSLYGTLGGGGRRSYGSAEHAEHHHGDSQSPCSFFYEISSFPYADDLVGRGEVGRQAASLAFLDQHDEDHEQCRQYDKNYEKCVHFTLFVIVIYYQSFKESNLVCKVSTFFWIIQI